MPKSIEPIRNSGFVIDEADVLKLLGVIDKGLVKGVGVRRPGAMCIEAAVCYALNLPHDDDPVCVDPIIRDIKIRLNDGGWSSAASRADGLRRLGILQLGTKGCFDGVDFAKRLVLMTIQTVLPIALVEAGLPNHAASCADITTLSQGVKAADAAMNAARYIRALYVETRYAAINAMNAAMNAANATISAARYAARYAENTARYAAANSAKVMEHGTRYAEYATRYAAAGAAMDAVLKTFAVGIENILIEMNVPAVRFLPLLEAK